MEKDDCRCHYQNRMFFGWKILDPHSHSKKNILCASKCVNIIHVVTDWYIKVYVSRIFLLLVKKKHVHSLSGEKKKKKNQCIIPWVHLIPHMNNKIKRRKCRHVKRGRHYTEHGRWALTQKHKQNHIWWQWKLLRVPLMIPCLSGW